MKDPRIRLAAYEAADALGVTSFALMVPNLACRLMIDDQDRVVAKQADGTPAFDQHGNPVTATDLCQALKSDPAFAPCWARRIR